nr:MAG TPA: hypothetical protein [Bacteriophage sp.]
MNNKYWGSIVHHSILDNYLYELNGIYSTASDCKEVLFAISKELGDIEASTISLYTKAVPAYGLVEVLSEALKEYGQTRSVTKMRAQRLSRYKAVDDIDLKNKQKMLKAHYKLFWIDCEVFKRGISHGVASTLVKMFMMEYQSSVLYDQGKDTSKRIIREIIKCNKVGVKELVDVIKRIESESKENVNYGVLLRSIERLSDVVINGREFDILWRKALKEEVK